MAGNVIAEAFVEISARLDSFENDLKNVNFRGLESDAEKAGEKVQGSMREASKQSDAELEKIGGAEAFDQVSREAEQAGEKVQGAFREAATQSNQELGKINDEKTSGGIGASFGKLAAVLKNLD